MIEFCPVFYHLFGSVTIYLESNVDLSLLYLHIFSSKHDAIKQTNKHTNNKCIQSFPGYFSVDSRGSDCILTTKAI